MVSADSDFECTFYYVTFYEMEDNVRIRVVKRNRYSTLEQARRAKWMALPFAKFIRGQDVVIVRETTTFTKEEVE